jgi:hypothetical protein
MQRCQALAFVFLSLAAAGCGRRQVPARAGSEAGASRVVIGGLSVCLPDGFVRKAYEKSREPLLNIPGESVEQVFASWEGPGKQSLYLFYWSSFPPRDLGPMVAARSWKTRIAGQEAEAAETETFMGLKQRVFVAWLERPGGAGRFMIYAKDVPRETFDRILATMSF